MNHAPACPIGLFDSGLGGLMFARRLHWVLPGEQLVYVGDSARLPYGPRTREELQRFSKQIASFLLDQGSKLIVIACNSATAAALETVQEMSPVPVVGVIEPGARAAVAASRSGVIGVIGTEATIRSGAYERLIRRHSPESRVIGQACPRFVPLVEAGQLDAPDTWDAAAEYLNPLKKQNPDTVILGCTHYPLLRPVIQSVLGEQIRLIDPAEATAEVVARLLEEQGLLNTSTRKQHVVYTSGDPETFTRQARTFWPLGFRQALHVEFREEATF